MTRKDCTTKDPAARVARIAWVFSFAIPLALLVLLCVALPAHALGVIESPPPPGPTEPAPEAEEAEAEAEDAGEECVGEEAGEEFEEGEISEGDQEAACEGPGRAGGVLPQACLLRTFRPRAVALTSRNEVQLTIDYTAYEPTAATVDFGIRGLRLGTAKRRLGTEGVLHLDRHLSASQTARVEATRRITIQIRIAAAPSRCAHYFSSDLTAGRASKNRIAFAPRRNG
jgi:hypothetical protein